MLLEIIGVCRMQQQTHLTLAAAAPAALPLNPAKIKNTHALAAKGADTKVVARTFGAKIHVVQCVREHAQWRDEIVELARFAG